MINSCVMLLNTKKYIHIPGVVVSDCRYMYVAAWFEDHATFVQFVLFNLRVDAGGVIPFFEIYHRVSLLHNRRHML